MGLGLLSARIFAATTFERCSRVSRCRREEATQSDTACKLGMEGHAGFTEERGVANDEELNIRLRIGLRGATFGTRIESGGRARLD